MAHLEIKLKALYEMSAQEREKTLSELVKGANLPRNGHPSRLDARIREFEVRFEMTSAELHERLRAGVLEETAEIAKWLFLLDARGEKGAEIPRRRCRLFRGIVVR